MRKKASQQKMYYFSDRLKRQLAQIPDHPLTIVEAPSGFGKTTAVREYLKENLPADACEYWYTCLGEPASMAWWGICGLLSNVNGEVADNLRDMEMPTMDTLYYMTAFLRDFHCQTETYLVVDNYQLVGCDVPHELLNVFATHGSPRLHMIFITQQLGTRQQFTVHNADIHTIDSTAFFFDREGTASLFHMEGLKLTEAELDSVYASTEGWVSAIRLQMLNYEETGSFDLTADIERLVETAIWNRLAQGEKEFLLSVSALDSFTARQAAVMLGQEVLPEEIERLLKTNDFIRYLPDKHLYSVHSILLDYLRNRFYHHQPREFQNRVLRLAGQAHAALGQYYQGAQYFLRVRDFDAILSMPWDGTYLGNQLENNLTDFIAAVMRGCPEETLCKYPFVLLMFGYPLLLCGQIELYGTVCRLIGRVIEAGSGLPAEELRRLRGEFALLKSFSSYNDIRAMSEGRRQALEILGGPSSIVVRDMPWTFGAISVLFMFWREPGTLDGTVRAMEECLPLYTTLTRGHGAGADSLLRAERMLMRGEDDQAEILCHKALYDARSHRQTAIALCAEMALARIAVLRGDVQGYFTAHKTIHAYAEETPLLYVLRMVDLCDAVLNLTLDVTSNTAKWLYDTESIRRTLYQPAVPYALVLHSKLLLTEKRYNELYGVSERILAEAESGPGNMRCAMAKLYQHIYLAAARRNNGDDLAAREHLREALAIAMPDRIFLPFAQQPGMADFLAETAAPDEGGEYAAILAFCRRQEKGVAVIRRAILQDKSPLTPREREVASLAKNRLSAREIAEKLFITEATVRTILKSVYSKLDVHSKIGLFSKEF